jgi:GNAT superfamily N-acetyltransferase
VSEEVRAIREDEYEECLALWKTVWPADPPGFFERYFFGDHDFQPEYTRVCVVNGQVVSAVHIVKRIVSCGDLTLTMGGVANVATLPEFRKRGYSSACLKQAIEIMEADAMDFSLLATGIHSFYARQGYETVEREILSGEIRPDFTHQYSYITVRPYEERDDAALHLIHLAFNRERPLTVRRSGPYWRDWIGWYGGGAPGKARIAELDGIEVGYCFYSLNDERQECRVQELAVRDGAEAAIGVLLEAAAADALAHKIRLLTMSIPALPEVREAAGRIYAAPKFKPFNGSMARLLHRDNLLRGLAPELTDRWNRAGSPQGKLTFATPYGAVGIEANSGFLKISTPDEESSASLSQADLFALLLGKVDSNKKLSESESVFARALFPPTDGWFWELDGF